MGWEPIEHRRSRRIFLGAPELLIVVGIVSEELEGFAVAIVPTPCQARVMVVAPEPSVLIALSILLGLQASGESDLGTWIMTMDGLHPGKRSFGNRALEDALLAPGQV